MPTRRNPYQRDPALAEAFNNLSQLFAPPSGADLAGYATAASQRAQTDQRNWLFNNSADPTASARSALVGLQNYAQTPSGFGKTDATNRRGQDVNAATDIQKTRMQQAGELERALLQPVAQGATRFVPGRIASQFELPPTQTGVVAAAPGERNFLPDGRVMDGTPKPLSSDEVAAVVMQEQLKNGGVTPQAVLGPKLGTPVQTRGADGVDRFSTPGEAMLSGATPAPAAAEKPTLMSDRDGNTVVKQPDGTLTYRDGRPVPPDMPVYNTPTLPTSTQVDNYLAVGEDGKELRFLGRLGLNGQVLDANTGRPVPNVVRREGTQGGMSFETDGKGGVRVVMGNNAGQTQGRVTDLQRQSSEAGRAVNELTAMFRNLRTDDVGVAGNVNEMMTNYGAQIAPNLARPDVAGTRNQMRATTLSLAKALVGDERLSDADRRAAEAVSVSSGIDESLPGARAKLASLIVINAYRGRYADSVQKGQKLAPLSPQVVGQLVDEGVVEPAVAEEYIRNNFARGSQEGGVVPGVQTPPLPGAGAGAPAAREEVWVRGPDGRLMRGQ